MFGLLTKAALIASVMGVICPDTNSSCNVACPSASTCTGSLNCATNALCTVTCNGTRSCADFKVDGVSANATTDYAVKCQGSSGCANAIFTAKTANTTRFLCSGNYSCEGTTFNCNNSTNCELVCENSNSCRNIAALKCPGGPGKTCNVACNGGCEPGLDVVCANYPCNITYSGSDGGAPSQCTPQLTCADKSCVSTTTTVCPSLCIAGDPCNKAAGNKCVDVGGVGNKYNCTCTVAAYKGSPITADGFVQSCDVPLGYGTSVTVTTYSRNDCTGTTRVKTYNAGCSSNTGVTGQSVYARCTATKYCTKFTTGSCASSCVLSSLGMGTSCNNGVKAKCNNINNGAGSHSVGAAGALLLLSAFFQY